MVHTHDSLSRASWCGQDQKCPLFFLGFPGGHRRSKPDFDCCNFSRHLRFCVPRTMTQIPERVHTHQCLIKAGFPCDCSQYAALLTGAASAQEWIPGGISLPIQVSSCSGRRECDSSVEGIRDIAWSTLGRPKSLHFQVRMDWKRVCPAIAGACCWPDSLT